MASLSEAEASSNSWFIIKHQPSIVCAAGGRLRITSGIDGHHRNNAVGTIGKRTVKSRAAPSFHVSVSKEQVAIIFMQFSGPGDMGA